MDDISRTLNYDKINKFVVGIGWQIVVLITVVNATVYENIIADVFLDLYYWLLICGVMAFTPIIVRNTKSTASSSLTELKNLLTPTHAALRGIGTALSIVEIMLLFKYNYILTTVTWVVVEVMQYVWIYRLKQAIELQGNIQYNSGDAGPFNIF